MEYKDVDILLVEDNPHDVELTLRALKKHNLANQVHVARDGQEALDFLFGAGPLAEIQMQSPEGDPPGPEASQGERLRGAEKIEER